MSKFIQNESQDESCDIRKTIDFYIVVVKHKSHNFYLFPGYLIRQIECTFTAIQIERTSNNQLKILKYWP